MVHWQVNPGDAFIAQESSSWRAPRIAEISIPVDMTFGFFAIINIINIQQKLTAPLIAGISIPAAKMVFGCFAIVNIQPILTVPLNLIAETSIPAANIVMAVIANINS